ncbi:MAG: hypothetical protein ACI9TA_002640, partial [Reinekea sp.]
FVLDLNPVWTDKPPAEQVTCSGLCEITPIMGAPSKGTKRLLNQGPP